MAKKSDDPIKEDDQTFLDRLVNFELTLSEFNHLGRLRVIWFYLSAGWNAGVMNARHQFQRFLNHQGASQVYHATELEFWCMAVWKAMEQDEEPYTDFNTFIAAHPHLVTESLIGEYYSPEVLSKDAAKQRPFPSDLKDLDELAAAVPSVKGSAEITEKPAEGKKTNSKSSKAETADKKDA